MTLIELIELIKTLCIAHPDIKGFYTGVASDKDDSIIEYPSVRVVYPFSSTPSDDENNTPTSIKLNIAIRVNKAIITVGASEMEINLNNLTENASINEINNDIALENTLRNKALRIATHLIEWFRLSEDSFNFLKVDSVSIKGIDRADADHSTGVDININFLVGKPYICEAVQLFEDHVNL